ncbi:MAG: YtcA family lipoprotein [Bradyrhizobium sp.]
MIPLINVTLARILVVARASIDRAQSGYLYAKLALVVALPTLLGGCGLTGAPSFSLFGAFFPAWLLCSTLGLLCAIVARILFVGTGLVDVLPFQLLVCTAIGALCGAFTWLLVFG